MSQPRRPQPTRLTSPRRMVKRTSLSRIRLTRSLSSHVDCWLRAGVCRLTECDETDRLTSLSDADELIIGAAGADSHVALRPSGAKMNAVDHGAPHCPTLKHRR